MKTKTFERIDLDMKELEEILERARTALSEDDHRKLKAAVETLAFLTGELEEERTTIKRLRNLLFGPRSEKTKKVFPREGDDQGTAGTSREGAPAEAKGSGDEGTKEKPKGHGRNAAAAYHGAEKIQVPHAAMRPKDPCPECQKGKV